jgi:curli biogenesis system outer membrane secretion channel CsgG
MPPRTRTRVLPIVTVSSFDNRSTFSGKWNLGSGMADILVSELMESSHFVVVERGELQKVVKELDLQHRPEFRKEGRVKTGNLKNAQFIIRGVINDFSQVGGSSLGIAIRTFLFGGKAYKARVALTLTVVEVESGQIMESVQCQGIARAREAYAQGTYKDITFGGDAFFKTPLGEATTDAIRDGVRELMKSIPAQRWQPMIADIINGTIVINGGANRQLAAGQVFNVHEEGRAVTDPVTGDLLSIITGPVIGRIKIDTVENKISFAGTVAGSGFKRGLQLKPAK